jgi:hypothetical protein
MKTATETRQRLQATIAKQTTEMLVTIARTLNCQLSSEAILTSSMVANELETRLPEADFLALMNELEAELSAA